MCYLYVLLCKVQPIEPIPIGPMLFRRCPDPELTSLISKTSKCLIFLNLLERKKKVLNAIIFKEIKKNFQGNPSLENLEALNCLETQFQGFQGEKSSFQAF